MNPVHIYFKEIDIDQNLSFAINFAKENENKNDLFDGQREYSVSSFVKKIHCEDFVKWINITTSSLNIWLKKLTKKTAVKTLFNE